MLSYKLLRSHWTVVASAIKFTPDLSVYDHLIISKIPVPGKQPIDYQAPIGYSELVNAGLSRQDVEGTIFDIQRFCIHDGPGIRTTVFLKGCVMRCAWCHNPESQSPESQLAFYAHKCVCCGRCLLACPNCAIVETQSRIDRSNCLLCGACAEACPAEALRLIGRTITTSQVIAVVERDQPYYRASAGGMTLSGGEPLLQLEFAISLLSAARDKGIHTAVETCGLLPWESLAETTPYTSLFLYDLKAIDPAKHRALCRESNEVILNNARLLVDSGAEVAFRTPLVPGVNDSPDDLRLLGEFVLALPKACGIELLPYNEGGSGKREAIGLEANHRASPSGDFGQARDLLTEMGVRVQND